MSILEAFREIVPIKIKEQMDDDFLTKLAAVEGDSTLREYIEKNMVSYAGILQDGSITLESYLHAIAYVTHKLVGDAPAVAYAKAFPQKYAKLIAGGTPKSAIERYARYYENTKLVSRITEQSLIPTWILNQDLYQKALNTQAALMLTAQSEKVRSDAANSILTHLSRPKEVAPLVNVVVNEVSELDILKDRMRDLAANQQGRIINGTPTKEIANEDIINGD